MLRQQLINHFLELPFRSGADQLFHDLTVLEEKSSECS